MLTVKGLSVRGSVMGCGSQSEVASRMMAASPALVPGPCHIPFLDFVVVLSLLLSPRRGREGLETMAGRGNVCCLVYHTSMLI